MARWDQEGSGDTIPFAEAVAPMEDTHAYAERGSERIDDVQVRGTNSEFLRIMGLDIRLTFLGRPARVVEPEQGLFTDGIGAAHKCFHLADPVRLIIRR